MKKLSIALVLAGLSACTTEQMVAQAKDECSQIGYPVGSPEYTECTERGFRGKAATQDAAAAATTSAVMTGILLNAMF